MVSVNQALTSQDPAEEIDRTRWLRSVAGTRDTGVCESIGSALDLVEEAFAGHNDGAALGTRHAMAVAEILLNLGIDTETVLAALLHDAVQNAGLPLEKVGNRFGSVVSELVSGTQRLDIISEYNEVEDYHHRGHVQSEALRKMLLAMVDDVRVVLIKLAIRLHNLRMLKNAPEPQRRAFARESMDIFAPLANRLGIWPLKWELEDLSFRYLEPEVYRQIARSLAERRVDRQAFLTEFVAQISQALADQAIEGEVTYRPKHIYSIWRKMQRKGIDFDNIYDVRAVRVLVKRVDQCYAALGVVHGLWRHIPREFDDYIAHPKPNLYRSLHTAVLGSDGRPVEIQIRTHEMHKHSEFGIAAHWRYKEGASRDESFEQKIAWLRQLLEWKDEVADANEFVDHFHSETFEDRTYVFTPQGKIIDLPRGATPLDFAYVVHTELGHNCRGAKVDGKIVPLSYSLNTGERVEILRTKRGAPSRDWLNAHLGYLKTSRARSSVKAWFKLLDSDQHISEGRHTLERELRRLGAGDLNLEHLAAQLQFKGVEEFYLAIGRGDIAAGQIALGVDALTAPVREEQLELPSLRQIRARRGGGDINIAGVGNLLTNMAKCCKPAPPDPIVGYITRGRGVTIHRKECPNILEFRNEEAERLIEVAWDRSSDSAYPVDVIIEAYDRAGLLRDITAVLANEKINVTAVNTSSDRQEHTAEMHLTIEVSDIRQLSNILSKIAQLPNIIDARRRR